MNSISLFILVVACCLCVVCDSGEEEDETEEVEKGVVIELITLKDPHNIQNLSHADVGSICDTHYDASLPTTVFIHGWQSKGELKKHLIRAYFHDGQHDINLIGINWENSSGTYSYPKARRRVRIIGNLTARYIDSLIEHGSLYLNNLSLIGFSLGAHIVGLVGKNLKSGKIRKITGLDPAGPLFYYNVPSERLAVGDALYVETIQTSKLGFSKPLGDVTFFPNGGRSQPGCSMDVSGFCSHQRSYKYFAQSINKPIYGQMCDETEDASDGLNCAINRYALLGGEPGCFNQTKGVYYVALKASD